MARAFKRIETILIHAGEPHPRIAGAVELPILAVLEGAEAALITASGHARARDVAP